jgi:hypothetical protein
MKKSMLYITLISLAALTSLQTQAAPILLGIGSLTGTTDKSGLTNTLENGVNANSLEGIGSGLAYAGNNTFLALPDRGPNANPYAGGAAVDNTSSYIARFQTLEMQLSLGDSSLPFSVTPTLSDTTLLYSNTALHYGVNGAPAQNDSNHYFFTGRSDNFAAGLSANPDNARLDPEGIRVSNDGKSVFISDEYGPYVYQFNRATGERIKSFTLPNNLAVSHLSSSGDAEISGLGNTIGRVANKGMEGLAITPDGKQLVGIMQAPLLQDTNKNVRLVTIDIATGTTHEYAYQLTTGTGVSEIVALNNHEFLVLERDGKGLGDNSSAVAKQIFKIDISGAQDVTGLSGNLSSKAIPKSLTLDVKAMLIAAGIDTKNIPAKFEGATFGEDTIYNNINMHTLWLSNDNDFLSTITDSSHPLGLANPNNFYVFGFSDVDLENYMAQKLEVSVDESSSIVLFSIGLIGLASLRRKK